jgi:adenylylsulfate kinase-like enzyme
MQNLSHLGHKVEIIDLKEFLRELPVETNASDMTATLNMKWITILCQILNRNGVITIISTIDPRREERKKLRQALKNFVEIFLNASLETLKIRDLEGIYKDAEQNKTSIHYIYESPENPELTIDTERETPESCAKKALTKLAELGYIELVEADYTEEEKEIIDQRLKSLGYM